MSVFLPLKFVKPHRPYFELHVLASIEVVTNAAAPTIVSQPQGYALAFVGSDVLKKLATVYITDNGRMVRMGHIGDL